MDRPCSDDCGMSKEGERVGSTLERKQQLVSNGMLEHLFRQGRRG